MKETSKNTKKVFEEAMPKIDMKLQHFNVVPQVFETSFEIVNDDSSIQKMINNWKAIATGDLSPMTRKQQAEYKKRKRKNLTVLKRHQKKWVKKLTKTVDVLHNLSIKGMSFPLMINIDHETNSLDVFKDFLQIYIDPYKNVSSKNP
jgi:hypothetical protein